MEKRARGEEENQSDQNEEVRSSTRRSDRRFGLHRTRSHGEGGRRGEEREEGRRESRRRLRARRPANEGVGRLFEGERQGLVARGR